MGFAMGAIRKGTTTLAALLVGGIVLASAARAQEMDTIAREAVIMDFDSGAVLFDKNAHEPMPPSSMSKLMTMNMLFEQLKDGRVKMTDTFPVSENAWREGGAGTEGSTMFAQLHSEVPVEALIRGVAVQSGNDACIVIAEGLAGTEAAFADSMNRRAKELGMNESHFTNSTGLPDPDHYMSAYDLALLSRHIIKTFPEYYHYFAEQEFTWNGIKQENRNPLLYLNIGVDGLKTGHTEAAGYGLTASGKRGEQRLIVVVNGLSSMKERAQEPRRLFELAFREFKTYDLFAVGAKVDDADVWNGAAGKVPLVTKGPVKVMMRRSVRPDMKVKVHYDGPVVAPVMEGQQVGTLEVSAPGAVTTNFPIYAGKEVKRVGPLGQIANTIVYLINGRPTADAGGEKAGATAKP